MTHYQSFGLSLQRIVVQIRITLLNFIGQNERFTVVYLFGAHRCNVKFPFENGKFTVEIANIVVARNIFPVALYNDFKFVRHFIRAIFDNKRKRSFIRIRAYVTVSKPFRCIFDILDLITVAKFARIVRVAVVNKTVRRRCYKNSAFFNSQQTVPCACKLVVFGHLETVGVAYNKGNNLYKISSDRRILGKIDKTNFCDGKHFVLG